MKSLFEQDIISFRKRYADSLAGNYGIFIYSTLLFISSFWMPWILIITILYPSIYIYSNYKVSGTFIYNWLEMEDGYKIKYLHFNEPRSVILKKDNARVEVYNNGFGISSMVSYHLRVSNRDEPLLFQYKGGIWNKEFMLDFVKQFDNSTTYSS